MTPWTCPRLITLSSAAQAELEASVSEGHSSQGSDLVHEAYTLAAQLVGPAAFTEAVSAHSATTGGAYAAHPSLAAMLSAIVVVLFGNDSDAERDGEEREGAAGRPGGPESRQGHLAAGLLELVQQCTVQAQRSDIPAATQRAVLGTLFTAARMIAPTLAGAPRDAFADTLLQITACAQHVLRQDAQPRGGGGPAAAADTVPNASLSNGCLGSADGGGALSGAALLPRPAVAADGSEIAVRATGAVVHVMRALRGTPSEVQLVTDTLTMLQQVPLPPLCDAALLSAVFVASAEATAAAAVEGGTAQGGLRMVAGQLTVQVAEDVKRAAATAAGALHAAGIPKGAGGVTQMDVHSATGSTDLHAHDDAVSAPLRELTQHVCRAAALLHAVGSGGGDGEEEDRGPVAAAARALLPMLRDAVPALSVALSADGGVRPACMSQLRQAWGQVIVAAVKLDAAAAVALTPTVFDVIAERASVDELVDWQHVLAVLIDRYLPRDGGHAPTADRILLALQKIWALPELQVWPAPPVAEAPLSAAMHAPRSPGAVYAAAVPPSQLLHVARSYRHACTAQLSTWIKRRRRSICVLHRCTPLKTDPCETAESLLQPPVLNDMTHITWP